MLGVDSAETFLMSSAAALTLTRSILVNMLPAGWAHHHATLLNSRPLT